MTDLNPTGNVTFFDAGIQLMHEPQSSVDETFESAFREYVFAPAITLLESIGWSVNVWEKASQYPALSPFFRTCRKGDLHGELVTSGRLFRFEMWQNTAGIDRNEGDDRHASGKEDRMAYVARLDMTRTRNHLCRLLVDTLGYTQRQQHLGRQQLGPGRMTAREWIHQHALNSGHYDPRIKRIPGDEREFNNRSKEGRPLTHGGPVYIRDHKGRTLKGIAYYNIGNMWWVVTGRYEVHNLASIEISLDRPDNLRAKQNQALRSKRLTQEIRRAATRMELLRTERLKQILRKENEPAGQRVPATPSATTNRSPQA